MSKSAPLIVFIEDNPADVSMMRRAIGELDDKVEFRVLSDGEQALRFVEDYRKSDEPLPCVILLDLHLPRHDGNSVLRAINREPILEHVQVAVWTTLASPSEREETVRLGAALYQLKPNTVEGFWELAGKLLDLCHGRAVGTAR